MEKMHQFMPKVFSKLIFEMAAENEIHIIEENLGKQIAGYNNIIHGEKLIHVNSEMPSYYKTIVIAYFLPKNTNRRTQEDGIILLTMEKVTTFYTQFQKYMELREAI